jgi:hypothetical protein
MDEAPNNGSHWTSCSMKRSASSHSAAEPEPESPLSLYVLALKL